MRSTLIWIRGLVFSVQIEDVTPASFMCLARHLKSSSKLQKKKLKKNRLTKVNSTVDLPVTTIKNVIDVLIIQTKAINNFHTMGVRFYALV